MNMQRGFPRGANTLFFAFFYPLSIIDSDGVIVRPSIVGILWLSKKVGY
jgi:hypothetical protein